MADTSITERQKFWRDHVLAAAAFDGTIVEYAKANNLKTKDIYQWKTSLTKRGLLDRGEKKRSDDTRHSYRCPNCEDAEIKTVPLPTQTIPKSNASQSTLIYLIIAKYLEGMPLFRLERQLNRYGIPVPRSTLANWMIQSGELIQPLINLMREKLISCDIVQMDESRFQVLREDGKTAQSQSYIWVQRGGPPEAPVTLYDYDPSRSHSVPMRLLEGFKGSLQTDAYEGYGPVCRDSQLISMGCMAHARRKFDEALKAQSAVDPNKTKSTLAATALKTHSIVVPNRTQDQKPVKRREKSDSTRTISTDTKRTEYLARYVRDRCTAEIHTRQSHEIHAKTVGEAHCLHQ